MRLANKALQTHRLTATAELKHFRRKGDLMPAQITTNQIWKDLEKEIFGVVGMVTAKAESRTAGIAYVVRDHKIFFATASTAWKTKHLRNNPHVSMTVPIVKRPFLPWIKIPAATITFSGTARVLALNEVSNAIPEALLKDLEGREELKKNCSIIEITPKGHFVTYGVGVSLQTMRRPDQAWGRVPVA